MDFSTKTGHAYLACPGLFSDYHSELNEIRLGFPRFFICPFHPWIPDFPQKQGEACEPVPRRCKSPEAQKG